MAQQIEALMAQKMFDIAPRAGEEIVHAQHFMAARQQGLAQEGADKAGAAGHQNALFQIRPRPPITIPIAARTHECNSHCASHPLRRPVLR